MLELVDQLADLVLPRECAGCGTPAHGAALCARCRPGGPAFQVPGGGRLEVFAATPYAGPVRAALLRYKERGRRDLGRALGELLARAVSGLLTPTGSDQPRRVVLVPVPSTRAASAARGGDHVVRLARRAGAPLGLGTVRALGLTRAVRDSAGLDAAERARNMAAAMTARPPPWGGGPAPVAVIVDDIATTGATLREAHRALQAAAWPVLGAAVVAATGRGA